MAREKVKNLPLPGCFANPRLPVAASLLSSVRSSTCQSLLRTSSPPERLRRHARNGHPPCGPFKTHAFLLSVKTVRRISLFRCQFENTSASWPLAALTNMTASDPVAHVSWPDLQLQNNTLMYCGPSQKKCPCHDQHFSVPTKGIDSENVFHTSSPFTLGEVGFSKRVSSPWGMDGEVSS